LEAPVIVTNIEDDIIVSTIQLASSNHWTIHPPIGVYPGIGVVVIKHNEVGKYGSLMTIGNEDMYSDPNTWNMSDIEVLLPDMSPVMQLVEDRNTRSSSPTWMTIKRIQGMERLSSREQVLFSQRTWFASKKLMKWYVKNIPSFPLTLSQIELHFDSQEVAFMRGHFLMRSHHQANMSEMAEELKEHQVYEKISQKEAVQDISRSSHYREELRNMVIGYETGSDIVPGSGNTSHRAIFVDKATGFKWSAVLPKKSHLPQAFTGYCDFMFQHGHTFSHFK
jgi:hypothetical protein